MFNEQLTINESNMRLIERNKMYQEVKAISISLLVCLFWFGYSAGETPSLPSEPQAKITNYQELIKTHQYAQAVTLMENTVKEATASSSEEPVLTHLKILLDDAQRQNKAFSAMIKSLTGPKKSELYLDAQTIIIIDKANESGLEGRVKDNLKDKRKVSWTDISVPNIYGLFDITKLKGEDKCNLAVWCFSHGLSAQAETVLAAFYKEQPSKLSLINPLLARIRNVPLPEGGFALYNDTTWITAETAQQRVEVLKKLGTYKGVLDKPGADSEKLPWEKARTKETEHFIVRTDLSMDALNDICIILESAYFTRQDFVGFSESKNKWKVSVFKNIPEYKAYRNDLMGSPGPFIEGAYTVSGETPSNKSHEDQLLVSYINDIHDLVNLSSKANKPGKTVNLLLHEGTHCAVHLLMRDVDPHEFRVFPTPLDEGLAEFFGGHKFEGNKLITDIDHYDLLVIKQAINKQSYVKLKDFINLNSTEFYSEASIEVGIMHYVEAWSLFYFLFQGNKRYNQGIHNYLEAFKQKRVVAWYNGQYRYVEDKDAHLKLFEECMGVPIDQLEQEWKEYILQLK